MSAPITELQNAFDNGLNFQAYLKAMTTLKNQMSQQYEALSLAPDSLAEITALLAPLKTVNILIITEDFCADSALNTPIVARLAEAIPGLSLRIVRREAYRTLADHYPTATGNNHIPTVIFFQPNGPQLGVWHERPTQAHQFLAQYYQENPQPEKHLPGGDLNPAYKSWAKARLQVQQTLYQESFAQETVQEFAELLKESVVTQSV